jgi:hypothetical protein
MPSPKKKKRTPIEEIRFLRRELRAAVCGRQMQDKQIAELKDALKNKGHQHDYLQRQHAEVRDTLSREMRIKHVLERQLQCVDRELMILDELDAVQEERRDRAALLVKLRKAESNHDAALYEMDAVKASKYLGREQHIKREIRVPIEVSAEYIGEPIASPIAPQEK